MLYSDLSAQLSLTKSGARWAIEYKHYAKAVAEYNILNAVLAASCMEDRLLDCDRGYPLFIHFASYTCRMLRLLVRESYTLLHDNS